MVRMPEDYVTEELAQKLVASLKIVSAELEALHSKSKANKQEIASISKQIGLTSSAVQIPKSGLREVEKLKQDVVKLMDSISKVDEMDTKLHDLSAKLAELPKTKELLRVQGAVAGLSGKSIGIQTASRDFDKLAGKIEAAAQGAPKTTRKEIQSLVKGISELSSRAEVMQTAIEKLDKLQAQDEINTRTFRSQLVSIQKQLEKAKGFDDIINKIQAVKTVSGLSDEELRKEITTLRNSLHGLEEQASHVEIIEKELAGLEKKLARLSPDDVEQLKDLFKEYDKDFFKNVKSKLESWKKETSINADRLTLLSKKLDNVVNVVELSEENKKHIAGIQKQIQKALSISTIPDVTARIAELDKEFHILYSSIGKERVEMDHLVMAVDSLRKGIDEWGEKNKQLFSESTKLKGDIKKVMGHVKVVDSREEVEELAEQVDELIAKVETLKKENMELRESQRKMIEFDKSMKEVVRKAVVSMLSREDFEKELEGLETAAMAKAARAPRPQLALPKKRTVDEKVKLLRQKLEKTVGPAPEPEEKPVPGADEVQERFERFKKELTGSSKEAAATLWGNARNDIIGIVKRDLDATRSLLAEKKAAGEDVSALNLVLTRQDIGLVSMETAFDAGNIEKAQEIIGKLVELRQQAATSLT